MKVSAIGYGMGNKDFEAANCVRAMLGETAETVESAAERVMFTATLPLCITLLNHGPPKSGIGAPAALSASSFSRTGLHSLEPLRPLWYM